MGLITTPAGAVNREEEGVRRSELELHGYPLDDIPGNPTLPAIIQHMCCSTYDLLCVADGYVESPTEPLGYRILLIGLLHIRRHDAPHGAATGPPL